MQVLACFNGDVMPIERAYVPVWDRGFLFGDSVYEVFRMYAGRRWLEAEHLARLKRSLKELEFADHDLGRLIERMDRTIGESQIREGTVYVQVTRGVAPCGSRGVPRRGLWGQRRGHNEPPRRETRRRQIDDVVESRRGPAKRFVPFVLAPIMLSAVLTAL